MMIGSEIVCPLCNSQKCELFHDYQVFKLFKCLDCSLIFQASRTDSNIINTIYDENWIKMREQSEITTFAQHADFNLFLLRIFLVPSSNILEIGSGTGEFLHLAKQSGYKVTGIEPSFYSCQYILNKYKIIMINSRADFQKIQFQDQFDAVCFWHVLEHIPSPINFLIELTTILKPNGYLLFSIPNQYSFTNEIYGVYSPLFQEIDHLFHYNVKNILNLLEKSGFKPVTIFSREEKTRFKSDLKALDGSTDLDNFSIKDFCLKNRLETTYKGHELFCIAKLSIETVN
jgi:SAM-dependent methyltransferase